MSARDPIHTEKLLAGTDWRLIREEEAQHVNAAYERTHRAWVARNEGEPMSFKDHFNAAQSQWVQPPLYNTPEPSEEADRPIFTPINLVEAAFKFALCLCAVGLCAAVVTWPRFGAVIHHIFN